MKTDDLIRALTSDLAPPGPSIETRFAVAFLPGVLLALALFAVTLGPRPDLALVASDMRFLFKFVVTLLLALCSALLVWRLVRPGAPARLQIAALAFVPLVLAAGVLVELFVLPTPSWGARLVGLERSGVPRQHSILCAAHADRRDPGVAAGRPDQARAHRRGGRPFRRRRRPPRSMRRIAPTIRRSSLRCGTALASPSLRLWAGLPGAWRCAGEIVRQSPVMALALATMSAGVA